MQYSLREKVAFHAILVVLYIISALIPITTSPFWIPYWLFRRFVFKDCKRRFKDAEKANFNLPIGDLGALRKSLKQRREHLERKIVPFQGPCTLEPPESVFAQEEIVVIQKMEQKVCQVLAPY